MSLRPFGLVLVLAALTAGSPAQSFSLALNGRDEWIEVPAHPELASLSDFTVETWVQVSRLPPGVTTLVGQRRRFPNWAGFTLEFRNGIVDFSIYEGSYGPAPCSARASWSLLRLGGWTHLAGVVSGRDVLLYVDGVLAGATRTRGFVPAATTPLRFGLDSEAPAMNPGSHLGGRLDEVRLWDHGRSSEELRTARFSSIDGRPGLVASWHFEGTLLDTTGGHDAVGRGGPGFGVDPLRLRCFAEGACLHGVLPVPLGSPWTIEVDVPAAQRPIIVLLSHRFEATSLGTFGQARIALGPETFALADPTGTFGPGIAPGWTDFAGHWEATLAIPNTPALRWVTLHVEAFVLDPRATNLAFRQSEVMHLHFD